MTWQRCAAWRSPLTCSTRPNWSVGFATYMTAKRPLPLAWRPQSWRKIASSPLIAITVFSSIFLSLWVWNFVELFGLLRFSGFMGCWKLFGIFWVVHVLVCGDFLGLSFSLSFATAEIRDDDYWWIWFVFDGKTGWKENMVKIPVEVGETFNAYLNLIFFELLLVY